jgi:hypothetical protein
MKHSMIRLWRVCPVAAFSDHAILKSTKTRRDNIAGMPSKSHLDNQLQCVFKTVKQQWASHP